MVTKYLFADGDMAEEELDFVESRALAVEREKHRDLQLPVPSWFVGNFSIL